MPTSAAEEKNKTRKTKTRKIQRCTCRVSISRAFCQKGIPPSNESAASAFSLKKEKLRIFPSASLDPSLTCYASGYGVPVRPKDTPEHWCELSPSDASHQFAQVNPKKGEFRNAECAGWYWPEMLLAF